MSHTNNAPLSGPIYSCARRGLSCVIDSVKKKFSVMYNSSPV